MYLQLLHSVTVETIVAHSLTVLDGDVISEPQSQCAHPRTSHVHYGVEEGHVSASNSRVADLGMERHA